MIRYVIDASATPSHTFAVTLTVPRPAAELTLSLPVWVPGSYLVREFARHLSGLSAEQGGRSLPLRQLDKASWRVTCAGDADLVVRYRVYAFDVSVRAAFLDATRGFFNGTSTCLRVAGREAEPHALRLTGLPAGWEVATTLAPEGEGRERRFIAPGYDELVDHPVELGRFWRGRFEAAGVGHEFVVAGALPDFDAERLLADTKKICETEIAFWHGAGKPPFERYLFLLNAVDEGHGGLEHRSSTALVAPRRELPRRPVPGAEPAASEPSDGYVGVLGLISHEYFHAWNVKRLKPSEFATFDYSRENYTGLLWFFEGFTSYYDDLFVVRSGRIDAARYLKLLGKTISAVAATPGRAVQSVAEASFDAWVKYYRQDENTPNATVSYYAKGSLVALAFDLTLRSEGHGTLDQVMRRLWEESEAGPIAADAIAAALAAVGGRSYANGDRRLDRWHGRASARAVVAALRRRIRSPAGDVGPALGNSRQREPPHRREGDARAAQRRGRGGGTLARRRADRRRPVAAAPPRRRVARPARRGFHASRRGTRPAHDRAFARRRHPRRCEHRSRSVAPCRKRERRGAGALRGMDRGFVDRPARRPRVARRVAFVALVAAVVFMHVGVSHEVAAELAELRAANAMPARIRVAYVRTLEPEAPKVAVPAPPEPVRARPRAPHRARPPAAPASSPLPPVVAQAASEPEAPRVDEAASAPRVAGGGHSAGERRQCRGCGMAPASAAASAPSAAGFVWPSATKVSYISTATTAAPSTAAPRSSGSGSAGATRSTSISTPARNSRRSSRAT